jgi:protein O-GlcNAc transferase
MNRQQRRLQEKLQQKTNQNRSQIQVNATYSDASILVQRAMQLVHAGNLPEAEQILRAVLARNPAEPDALLYMGVVAHLSGHNEIALELLQHADKVRPNHLDTAINLSSVYMGLGKSIEAEYILNEAISQNPEIPELRFNLCNLHIETERYEEALVLAEELVRVRPEWKDVHAQKGVALKNLKRYDEALLAYDQALAMDPDFTVALKNKGNLLIAFGKSTEALECYERLLEIGKDIDAEVYNQLGNVYGNLKIWEKSIQSYSRALQLNPNDAGYYDNLACVLFLSKQTENVERLMKRAIELSPETSVLHFNLARYYQSIGQNALAMQYYERAIELDPVSPAYVNMSYLLCMRGDLLGAEKLLLKAIEEGCPESGLHINLGNVYKDLCSHEQALDCYQKALEVNPKSHMAQSNQLFVMHYIPSIKPEQIYQESVKWEQQQAVGIVAKTVHANIPDPERVLKIGYVSADLRDHPVMCYIEPILEAHDKSKVEVYCYANQEINDPTTDRLKYHSHHWRDVFQMTDDEMAEQVERDGIDILVDLSGHTSGNRLLVFARKPAPIQATWIGYFNTTGVKAIDYIISDKYMVPPEDEHLYTEKPLRMAKSACYQVHKYNIPVAPPPVLKNGYLTFGCFSTLGKFSSEVLEVWAEILKAIPDSRLYLKNAAFGLETTRVEYREKFQKMGVDPERIDFQGAGPLEMYLVEYNNVDLMLDTFPYNAGTTALDALWMGLSMITLKGDRLVARIGEGLLGALELEEFIAKDKQDYVAKAVAYSKNPQRLAEVRGQLRAKLEAHPMTNPPVFTRGLEDAYRSVWRKWCEQQNGGSQ